MWWCKLFPWEVCATLFNEDKQDNIFMFQDIFCQSIFYDHKTRGSWICFMLTLTVEKLVWPNSSCIIWCNWIFPEVFRTDLILFLHWHLFLNIHMCYIHRPPLWSISIFWSTRKFSSSYKMISSALVSNTLEYFRPRDRVLPQLDWAQSN